MNILSYCVYGVLVALGLYLLFRYTTKKVQESPETDLSKEDGGLPDSPNYLSSVFPVPGEYPSQPVEPTPTLAVEPAPVKPKIIHRVKAVIKKVAKKPTSKKKA